MTTTYRDCLEHDNMNAEETAAGFAALREMGFTEHSANQGSLEAFASSFAFTRKI